MNEEQRIDVGSDVLIMSAPGRHRVVARNGQRLTIESASGTRKIVMEPAVRLVPIQAPPDPATPVATAPSSTGNVSQTPAPS